MVEGTDRHPDGSDGAGEASPGVAIVTGAGGGIGSAIVGRLAAAGMSLVLSDRDLGMLDAVVASIPGTPVRGVAGDVAEPDHHLELVAAAEDLGGLSVSVLNAGVVLPGLSWEVPIAQWELHVRVNYWGVVHGVRAALDVMVPRGLGHVVAVASGAGLVATPGLAPYVSTKHAVVGLMESVRHELARAAPGVRSSVVCPGNVRTSMTANSLAAAEVDQERLSPVAQGIADVVRAGVDEGASPDTVAEALVAALADGRFWVLPQPEVGLGALDRVQRIVDGRGPVDLLM